MKIDAHHHFWNYDPIRYSWMNNRMDILKRITNRPTFQAEIERVGIDGVVSVQADQSMLETDELLEHAAQCDFIKGVVGWFPLADPAVEETLSEYRKTHGSRGCGTWFRTSRMTVSYWVSPSTRAFESSSSSTWFTTS